MSRFAFADEVRAVVFDLGNTLMGIDHAMLADALASAGFAADEADVRRAEFRARPAVDGVVSKMARREGREVLDVAARRFLDELRPGLGDEAAARSAFFAVFPSLWRRVPDDARPTLDGLRARGFRLAVVSNTGDGRARSRLADAALLDALEFVVDSHEVGVEKPDPRIFEHAVRRLGVAPSACVYVGDLYSVDVLGARAAGMHAALIDPMDVWTHVDAPRVATLSELARRL